MAIMSQQTRPDCSSTQVPQTTHDRRPRLVGHWWRWPDTGTVQRNTGSRRLRRPAPPGKIKCSAPTAHTCWTGLRRKRSRGFLALARSDRCRAPILSGPARLLIRSPQRWRSLGSSSCWLKLGPAPAPTERHQTDEVSRPDRRYAVLIVPSPAVLTVPSPASPPVLVTNIAWRHLDRRTCVSGRGRTALSRLSEGGSLAASLTRTRQRTRRAGPGAKQGQTHRPGEGAQQRPLTPMLQ